MHLYGPITTVIIATSCLYMFTIYDAINQMDKGRDTYEELCV